MKERYFFDTEFIEDGKTIDLISIGIVTSTGREFYAVSTDAKLHLASDWVRNNVLPHLPPYTEDPLLIRLGRYTGPWMPRRVLVQRLLEFVVRTTEPEFWAYYADYDWVALCQLFGTMVDLPSHFPKYAMDLKQYSKMLGSPRHPGQAEGTEHNALEDARWNQVLYQFLKTIERERFGGRMSGEDEEP